MKYLSIIINFGCHYTCPYCIVKENNLKIPTTTFQGLQLLNKTIEKNGINIVSISGGGDPLYNYSENKGYYDKVFDIVNKPIEMHTSYLTSDFPMEKCARVVYHVSNFKGLSDIRRKGNELVRAVFVVTESFTRELIDQIYDYCTRSQDIDELSFRQMVDSNYQTTNYCYDYLMEHHQSKWWYVEQNDYNLYYVENSTYVSFKDIGMAYKIQKGGL